ncbi:MAG TPA: hypothetical protein VF450_06900 [Noviherbaspirillum sp.]
MDTDVFKRFEEYCCPVCEPGGIARGFITWFRIRPESAQALHNLGAGEKAKYEQAIRAEIAKHGFQMVWDASEKRYPLNTFDPGNVYGKRKPDEPPVYRDVCVGLFFGLTPDCTDKDVDNMTKLFLDALKGPDGLFHDDKAVVHLDVLKRVLMPSADIKDNYLVGVRISLVRSTVKRIVDFTWHGAVPPIAI